VTASEVGHALIRVDIGDASSFFGIDVVDMISPSNILVLTKSEIQFSTLLPLEGSWSSSDTSIVSINSKSGVAQVSNTCGTVTIFYRGSDVQTQTTVTVTRVQELILDIQEHDQLSPVVPYRILPAVGFDTRQFLTPNAAVTCKLVDSDTHRLCGRCESRAPGFVHVAVESHNVTSVQLVVSLVDSRTGVLLDVTTTKNLRFRAPFEISERVIYVDDFVSGKSVMIEGDTSALHLQTSNAAIAATLRSCDGRHSCDTALIDVAVTKSFKSSGVVSVWDTRHPDFYRWDIQIKYTTAQPGGWDSRAVQLAGLLVLLGIAFQCFLRPAGVHATRHKGNAFRPFVPR